MKTIKAVISNERRERDISRYLAIELIVYSQEISHCVRYDGSIGRRQIVRKKAKGWGYVNKLKQIGDQMQAGCGAEIYWKQVFVEKKLLLMPEKLLVTTKTHSHHDIIPGSGTHNKHYQFRQVLFPCNPLSGNASGAIPGTVVFSKNRKTTTTIIIFRNPANP